MLYAILVLLLVAADQALKFWVRAAIPLGEALPFLPGVLQLTYVQNTGAAFSLFSQHTWILAILSAVMSVFFAWVLLKKGLVTMPFGRLSVALVLAGAVGNFIDRAFFGYVTDMFETVFMNFAVFNIADICVVVGGIALCVYVVFFYEKYEQKGGAHDAADTDRR